MIQGYPHDLGNLHISTGASTDDQPAMALFGPGIPGDTLELLSHLPRGSRRTDPWPLPRRGRAARGLAHCAPGRSADPGAVAGQEGTQLECQEDCGEPWSC